MIAGVLSRIGILLAANLPPRTAHRLAALVGRLEYRLAASHRLDPLRAVVGRRLGLSRERAEPVVRAILERKAVDQLQGGLLRFRSKRRIASLVEIRGLDALKGALQRGRGCLLYSGHFWGHWIFFAALGMHGYHPLIVRQSAPLKLSRTAAWFQRRFDEMLSTKFGCEFLWMGPDKPMVGALAAAHLKRNAVVVDLLDISSYTNHLTDVDFLNKREALPVGPALLSQKTGAPMLPYSISYSAEEARYICNVGPDDVVSQDLQASTQRLAARLELRIRAHPEDWAGWLKRQYLGG